MPCHRHVEHRCLDLHSVSLSLQVFYEILAGVKVESREENYNIGNISLSLFVLFVGTAEAGVD